MKVNDILNELDKSHDEEAVKAERDNIRAIEKLYFESVNTNAKLAAGYYMMLTESKKLLAILEKKIAR